MAQTPDVQDIGLDRTANWKWKVKPIKGGPHKLHAQVEILVRGPDGQLVNGPDGTPKTLDSYDRYVAIKVEVGTGRGFMNALRNAADAGDLLGTLFRSWEKTLLALAALITALGAVLMAVRKLRGTKRPGRRRKKG